MSLGSMLLHGYVTGILFTLAAIVAIPSSVSLVEKKTNVSMPRIAQFFIVFFLVAVALAALPVTPTANNNTTNNTEIIAASSSANNGSEALVLAAAPKQVETPTPVTTPIPVAAPTSKPIPVITPTTASPPVAEPTPILDIKGKLDIFTTPAGATITIDGVSKGVSPIEGLSVDEGTHSVMVYLSGYVPQKENIKVTNSEAKELFYTLVPEATQSKASKSIQEETLPSEATSTSTLEETSYQDAQWLLAGITDMKIVTNDMNYVSSAATAFDLASLSIYANSLLKDSQNAIDNSDSYEVSPDLQGAKDEYRLAMVQANWAAFYINEGIEEFNNGNTQAATSDFEQSTQNMESCTQHMNKATKMLESYNSKQK